MMSLAEAEAILRQLGVDDACAGAWDGAMREPQARIRVKKHAAMSAQNWRAFHAAATAGAQPWAIFAAGFHGELERRGLIRTPVAPMEGNIT